LSLGHSRCAQREASGHSAAQCAGDATVDAADPRIDQLIEELAQARGKTLPFLVWSSPLPPGDEAEAVNLLFCEPRWLFNGGGDLDEIDEDWAVELLTWLFGHTLAYDVKLMPEARAAELASLFLDLLPNERRWFSNGSERGEGWQPRPNPWDPLTEHTFDSGVVAVGDGFAWVAWFTDDD
jgi:hypothetical protein